MPSIPATTGRQLSARKVSHSGHRPAAVHPTTVRTPLALKRNLFLYIAKGSCGEAREQLQIALDQSYISAETHTSLTSLARMISGMISNFIAHLQRRLCLRSVAINMSPRWG